MKFVLDTLMDIALVAWGVIVAGQYLIANANALWGNPATAVSINLRPGYITLAPLLLFGAILTYRHHMPENFHDR